MDTGDRKAGAIASGDSKPSMKRRNNQNDTADPQSCAAHVRKTAFCTTSLERQAYRVQSLGEPRVDIRIVEGDALDIVADVLVLKYAQALYGVDELAVDKLDAKGEGVRRRLPEARRRQTDRRPRASRCEKVLFVGVVKLRAFGYEEIREFAHRAMMSLADALPSTSHVALTLHGAGYGLDEAEAFRSELAGLLEAIETGTAHND